MDIWAHMMNQTRLKKIAGDKHMYYLDEEGDSKELKFCCPEPKLLQKKNPLPITHQWSKDIPHSLLVIPIIT